MMDRIREAYWSADTQKDGLTAVARILQNSNHHLSMVLAIVHADAIAYCLHEQLDRCASVHMHEALNYSPDCPCHNAPDCCGSTTTN